MQDDRYGICTAMAAQNAILVGAVRIRSRTVFSGVPLIVARLVIGQYLRRGLETCAPDPIDRRL